MHATSLMKRTFAALKRTVNTSRAASTLRSQSLIKRTFQGFFTARARVRHKAEADVKFELYQSSVMRMALSHWRQRRYYGLVDMHLKLAKFARYKQRCLIFEWHKVTLKEEIYNLEIIARFHVTTKLSQSFSQLKTLLWKRKLIEAKRSRLRLLIWRWFSVTRENAQNPFLLLAM